MEKTTGTIVEHKQRDDNFLDVILGDQYILLKLLSLGQPNQIINIEKKCFLSPFKDTLEDNPDTSDIAHYTLDGKLCCHGSTKEVELLKNWMLTNWTTSSIETLLLYSSFIKMTSSSKLIP
eukprot:13113554-Ditylum_brightwellii.AAC.1